MLRTSRHLMVPHQRPSPTGRSSLLWNNTPPYKINVAQNLGQPTATQSKNLRKKKTFEAHFEI